MSESVEMYLITTARLSEATGQETIPLSQIAKALSVLPISANQMIRKIAESGLVEYIPYKGVKLTKAGCLQAMRILRRRRLWQVFLVEKLNVSPEDADAFSCRLEHITPDDIAERLAEFLGHPTVSPLGKPIPACQAVLSSTATLRLSSMAAGQSSRVVRIDTEPATRVFLVRQGIWPGNEITVLAVSGGGTLLVQVGDRQVTLAGAVAEKVVIEEPKKSETATSKPFREEEKPVSTKQIPLSELSTGQAGVVVKIKGQGALHRRLLDMGLVTGETIKVERAAPLGDPVEFTLKGYHLSLRKEEADGIIVEVNNNE